MTDAVINLTEITDNQVRDLMIFYATRFRDWDFGKLYRTLYHNAEEFEILRCASFIRLALGIIPDKRNIY